MSTPTQRDDHGRFAGDDGGVGAMFQRDLERKRAAQTELREIFFPPPASDADVDVDEAA